MNRRNFLFGTIALAGQQKLVRSLGTGSFGRQGSAQAMPPQNLLSKTYPESFLISKLIKAKQWHPIPRASEREPWLAIPHDIRTVFVEHAETDRKKGWNALLATAYLNYKRNGNQAIYEVASYGRRAQLRRMVIAECIEGKGHFIDEIANGVWLICEESSWVDPAHCFIQRAGPGLPDVSEPVIDLLGASTVQMLAWIYYLLGEQLDHVSPLISRRIQIEAEQRILEPARRRNDFWWMGLDGKGGHMNNWNPWINSNLLVANLLLEEDRNLLVQGVAKITRSLDEYLNQYWPDAGEEEGPVYFGVSPMCYFECVSMIESATGDATAILSNPFINAMGRFILNAHIAGEDYINYGDAHVKSGQDGTLLYRFGKAVRDKQLEAFGAKCAATDGLTAREPAISKALKAMDFNFMGLTRPLAAVLMAKEIRGIQGQDALVRDAWYPSLGLMTARRAANSTQGMYVAVLAANNGRTHGHNDTGSYIVYQDGERVAIDVGVELYSARTFGADRYSIWTMQSAYHNLPTVGGAMQHNGSRFKATSFHYESNDGHARYSFDIAPAYPRSAWIRSWLRTVTLDREADAVRVEENFELDRTLPVSLTVMTPRVPSVNADGYITLKPVNKDGRASLLRFDSAQLQPVIEKIPLTDFFLCEDWGNEIYRILFNSKKPMKEGSLYCEFTHA